MFRFPLLLAILTTFTLALFQTDSVEACPMCKLANESATDDSDSETAGVPFINNRPKAYMYSILFMIGMPATLFTIFGILFYRMIRKAQLAQAAGELSQETVPGTEFDGMPLPSAGN